MAKDIGELKSSFQNIQKDIVELKQALAKAEKKKQYYLQQACYHLIDICPGEYRRLFDHSHSPEALLRSKNNDIESMFSDSDQLFKDIFNCSLKIKKIYFENASDTLLKIYDVEGIVGDITFLVEFAVMLNKNDGSQENDIDIRKLEFFPEMEVLFEVASVMKSQNVLKTLIPCLHMFQRMKQEQVETLNTLESDYSVNIIEENDVPVIIVQTEPKELRVEWSLSYNHIDNMFHNSIAIATVAKEVLRKYSNSQYYPVLKKEETLADGREIISFIESLFETP